MDHRDEYLAIKSRLALHFFSWYFILVFHQLRFRLRIASKSHFKLSKIETNPIIRIKLNMLLIQTFHEDILMKFLQFFLYLFILVSFFAFSFFHLLPFAIQHVAKLRHTVFFDSTFIKASYLINKVKMTKQKLIRKHVRWKS